MRVRNRTAGTALVAALVPMTVLSLLLPIVAHAQQGPTLTIDNPRVTETAAGSTTKLVFTVTMRPSAEGCRVAYSTAGGTATAGVDYERKSGFVPVDEAGIAKVAVIVRGDTNVEGDETIELNVSEAPDPSCSGTQIMNPQGIGRILDNDVEADTAKIEPSKKSTVASSQSKERPKATDGRNARRKRSDRVSRWGRQLPGIVGRRARLRGVSTRTAFSHGDPGCPAIASAMDEGGIVVGESWVECSAVDANGTTGALGAAWPMTPTGGQMAVMTNGDRSLLNTPATTSESAGRSNDGYIEARNAFDVSILKVDLEVPKGANCLSLDVVFGSEEYEEWVGASFNDGFLAELGQSSWRVEQDASITAPNNFAFDQNNEVVSVNTTFFASGMAVVPTGTEYDGSTPLIQARTPITPGNHSLILSIFDAGDGVYDSGVTLDNLRAIAAQSEECAAGAVVAENFSPVADDDVGETEPGTPIDIAVLDNDSDPDGDPLTVTEVTVPANGTAAINEDGTITYTPDPEFEGTDSFTYTVSDGNGGFATATVEILVGDAGPGPGPGPELPAISITDAEIVEGDEGTQDLVLDFAFNSMAFDMAQVDFATSNGSADAGSDYVDTSGTLVIPGELEGGVEECVVECFFLASQALAQEVPTTDQIVIPIIGDTVVEDDETFFITLSTPSQNVEIGNGNATVTIIDDDVPPEEPGEGETPPEEPGEGETPPLPVFIPPTVTIGDTTLTEGDDGTTEAQFPVSLSRTIDLTAVVNFATSDGTAVGGDDYQGQSATVSFAPGQTTQTVTIPVNGDVIDEDDETFYVDLFGASNATIAGGRAAATIIDDDDPPSIAIGSVEVTEGNADETTLAEFPVTLSNPSSRDVTVDFATADQTATATDYGTAQGSITFAPGETAKTVAVDVFGDALDESDETFLVELSGAVAASLSDIAGVGTILDDDAPPTLSIQGISVAEGDSGTIPATFSVALSRPSGLPVAVDFVTLDDAATAPEDYRAASGTLEFAPGQTTRFLTVDVNGDEIDEDDEDFIVRLSPGATSNVAGGSIGAAGTIIDDDSPEDEVLGTRIFNDGRFDSGDPANELSPDPEPSEEPPAETPTDEDPIPGADEPDEPEEPAVARLSSPSIQPGGEIVLAGSGCGANSVIPISLNGQSVATTRADEQGSFEFAFQSPSGLAVGRHDLEAKCGERTIETTVDVVLTSNQGGAIPAAPLITVGGMFLFLMFEASDLLEQERGEGRHRRRRRLLGSLLGRSLDVDEAEETVAVRAERVGLAPLSRLHILGAALLALAAVLVSLIGIGATPQPTGAPEREIFVSGTDLGAGAPVELDANDAIPIRIAQLPQGAEGADEARLAFSVAGIELTDGDAPLVRSGKAHKTAIDASARAFLLAGTYTGELQLLDDGAVVSTHVFEAESDEPFYLSPAGEVTAGLVLFALAGMEFILRRIRRRQRMPGGKYAAGGPGVVLGLAIVGVVSLVSGQEPTLLTIIFSAVIGGAAGLVLGTGALKSAPDSIGTETT